MALLPKHVCILLAMLANRRHTGDRQFYSQCLQGKEFEKLSLLH